MAKKHRKLHPSSQQGNNSATCPDICDPICPDGCDSFPIFYYSSPPPPPSSPPLPPMSPPATSQGHHQVSPQHIVLATVLSGLFLLLCSYVVIVKCLSARNVFRRQRTRPAGGGGDGEGFVGENHGPVVDHPIWYINTIGLQSSVINSIAMFRYKKGEGLIDGSTCSVCLSEFGDGETLRLLPNCSHAFHVRCIDTWLRSHTNCPLCRAGIMSSENPRTLENQNPRIDRDRRMENAEDDDDDDEEVERVAGQDDDDGDVYDGVLVEAELQRVRRCLSMDLVRVQNRNESEGTSVDPAEGEKRGFDGNSGILMMMRSFSYGGRPFLLRQPRNIHNPNPILPH